MPKDLFCMIIFTVQYILRNKINAVILVDTYATRFGFIDKKFIEIISQMLEIKPQCLT